MNLWIFCFLIMIMPMSTFKFVLSTTAAKTLRLFSSGNTKEVKVMNVVKLNEILKSSTRINYQIVDVREKHELEIAALPDKNVIHLPLSENAKWTPKLVKGELLDKTKTTLCLCRSGARSGMFADFLSKDNLMNNHSLFFILIFFSFLFILVSTANFDDVYNIQGGILAYSAQIDPSIKQY